MKFCYVDESGTGDEPFGVMVGVIVDALRMRPTKRDWDGLLKDLTRRVGRQVTELHAREFYSGNGIWRDMNGSLRSEIMSDVFNWIAERKHSIIYASIDKNYWYKEFPKDKRYDDLNTLWRFLGLHLVLGIQKHHQRKDKNKGNTVLVFDNEECEKKRFTDLIQEPPDWIHTYYGKASEAEPLDQIVDVPYFADSKDVPLLQLADFVAFFLRRHVELENNDEERYEGERAKVAMWVKKALGQRILLSAIYPKKGRCSCAEMFHQYAPSCLRDE